MADVAAGRKVMICSLGSAMLSFSTASIVGIDAAALGVSCSIEGAGVSYNAQMTTGMAGVSDDTLFTGVNNDMAMASTGNNY
jgi:hypothetical protein